MRYSQSRIAFVSPHCLVDFTNGAATATRDGLKLLAAQGFQCMAFCGTRLDEAGEGLIQEQLLRRKIKYVVKNAKIPIGRELGAPAQAGLKNANCKMQNAKWGQRATRPLPEEQEELLSARMIFLVEENVPVTLFENASTRGGWFGAGEVGAFLAACDIFLRKNRPDVVITYGGDPVSIAVQELAKWHGATVVFWLHNFGYANRLAFAAVDYIIVPSEFSRRYYREKIGLQCNVLPNVVHWKDAAVARGAGFQPAGEFADWKSAVPSVSKADWRSALRYVTFINPEENKGVYVFARIARELARRRPDIPLLVTQGRSRGDALKDPALGLAPHLLGQFPTVDAALAGQPAEAGTPARNITTMPFTPDPRDFYPAVFARTKLLLMPSLWLESFGLVAAEAMLNGIPVLASNRGALPETIGNGGFLFDIPARYRPETRDVPTAEEVAPWVDTIIRLWDDDTYYDRCSRAARERAKAWHPDRLAPLYRDFFTRIVRQRSSPPAPQEAAQG